MEHIGFAASHDALQPGGSQSTSGKTGLRLVIPSLRQIKASKLNKKTPKGVAFHDAAIQKTPRPTKLKPLKEVLTKLISQIKKKDDYAFFLQPVDVTQVPGYTNVVQHPMDFGTISQKVQKGRYRSLEEFANDVRLVTSNAKIFNPPGTIYHTEAQRLETYAIDHINRAAATVIEIEGDWNFEGEQDEEADRQLSVVDGEEQRGTPMDVDATSATRSPSVLSAQMAPLRRGTKSKKQITTVSESLEADGHLPGFKDGVGAFPPNTEWADLMLSLKLKGKRFRSKKERMRAERGGPPYAVDGSLAYTEMEDPFSVLSVFLPEPPSRPALVPLHQPTDPSLPGPSYIPPPEHFNTDHSVRRKKQWNIVRSAPVRRRDIYTETEEFSEPENVRHPHASDFGTFALLQAIIREHGLEGTSQGHVSESEFHDSIRKSVHTGVVEDIPPLFNDVSELTEDLYWSRGITQAEDYLQDMVYGGVDGQAYIRSLAEFVNNPPPEDGATGHSSLGMPLARYVEERVVDPLTDGRHRILREASMHLYNFRQGVEESLPAQVDFALNVKPRAAKQLVDLRNVLREQLDMAALLYERDELFTSDKEWAGKTFAEEQRRKLEEERERAEAEKERALADGSAHPMQYLAFAIKSHEEAQNSERLQPDIPGMLQYALNHSAQLIIDMAKAKRDAAVDTDADVKMKTEDDEIEAVGDEDPAMRRLRLNLLALAKRAPLDKITRLPIDFVPEPIRHIVPTFARK